MFYKNKTTSFYTSDLTRTKYLLVGFCLLLGACAKQDYTASPINVESSFASIAAREPGDAGFRDFLQQNGYSVSDWPLKHWEIDTLTLAGLYFHPQLKADIAGLAVFDADAGIASQRRNPRVSLPLENRGEDRGTPWAFGVVTQFLYERKDKRLARIAQAEAKKQAALVRVEQKAWSMYIGMHRDLVAYREVRRRHELLGEQQGLLEQILELTQRRYDLGRASSFEVSSARLQLQRLNLELTNLESATLDAFQKVSNRTGLSNGKISRSELVIESLMVQRPSFLNELGSNSHSFLLEHYDIRAGLFDYLSFEAALKLEIEKQYPDVNLSPGFVLEQGDNIFSLGAQWLLPIFHNNDAQIERALAQREYRQRQFIALQTRLHNELENRSQKFHTASAAWQEARDLVKELQSRQSTLRRQYDLGYIDRLNLLGSQLETVRARLSTLGLETAMLNALVALEEIVQVPVHDTVVFGRWLEHLQNSLNGSLQQ